ncbi:hypothetical protein GCM10027612_23550 [Microbispora bryophytorum subsp. camponoti]
MPLPAQPKSNRVPIQEAVLADRGVHHVYVTATTASKDVNELIDNSAAIHEAVRGAGL